MLRRYGILLLHMSVEGGARDTLRTARRVERKRVAALQSRKATRGTNTYNKAQYVNAFIESQSMQLSRQRRLKEGTAEEQALLAVLESTKSSLRPSSDLSSSSLSTIAEKRPLQLSRHTRDVGFGSWREGDPRIERTCLAMDCRLHRIMRGATTPPSFSPEALRRGILFNHMIIRELFDTIHVKRSAREWGRCVERCLETVCGGDTAIASKFLALLMHEVAAFDWELALQLHNDWALPHVRRLSGTADQSEVASMLVAVLCESIRANYWEASGRPGPSFRVVMALHDASPVSLLPVSAAPLFSILRPSDTGETWHDLMTLAQRLWGNGRCTYLPSIAWAELLKAAWRMGATTKDIQSLVDTITDSKRTKHADQLLRDTNVWNAYLLVSDWQHAMEVFTNNLEHYGVKETAATSAALMESMLRDKQSERALDVFKRLRSKEGQLMVGTSGVFVAAFKALGQQGDWKRLTALLTNYEEFHAQIGVPHEWWKEKVAPLRSCEEPRQENDLQEWMDLVTALPSQGHATIELVTAIKGSLTACGTRFCADTKCESPGEPGEMDRSLPGNLVTAEDLYDIL